MPVASDIGYTDGETINRGPVNHEVLALSGNYQIVTHAFEPDGALVDLGRSARDVIGGRHPVNSIAWSMN